MCVCVCVYIYVRVVLLVDCLVVGLVCTYRDARSIKHKIHSATKLRAERSGVQFPKGTKTLFPRNVETGPGIHPVSYSTGNGVLSRGLNCRGVKLRKSKA